MVWVWSVGGVLILGLAVRPVVACREGRCGWLKPARSVLILGWLLCVTLSVTFVDLGFGKKLAPYVYLVGWAVGG